MKRSTDSLEYKLETIALVLERGLSPRQVSKDLGIDRSTVAAWVRKARAGELGVPGAHAKTQEQLTLENQKLRRENVILREEREILKGAAAFFARDVQ
jgi:transposase